MVDRSFRVTTADVDLACRDSRQDLDTLIDRLDRYDPELAGRTSIDDVLAQHQMLYVGRRNQHTLCAIEPAAAANVEETLDFLVHTADGLHQPVLIDRAGDSVALLDRHIRESRKQGIELRG